MTTPKSLNFPFAVPYRVITRAVSVLEKSDRSKILLIVFVYATLGLLDIVAVFVFGIVGSLAVSGISTNVPGTRVAALLEFLNLDEKSLQTQVATLGVLAAIILTLKSIVSLYLSRRTLLFLSRRSAVISRNLLNRFLGQEILQIRLRTIQETIFALTVGVQTVTVNILGSTLLLVADVFLVLAFSFSLFFVDTVIALLSVMIFSSVGFLLYSLMHKRAQYLGERATKLEIRSGDKISEVVSCYRELLVKNRRAFYANEIGNMRLEIAEAGANLGVMSLLSKYIMEIATVVGGLVIGAVAFVSQPATRAVAIIAIFLITSARVAPAILRIQSSLITIRTSIGTAKPTLDLIEHYQAEEELSVEPLTDSKGYGGFEHTDFRPNICFSNVSFSYPTTKENVIRDLSLRIEEGEFIGIVGSSGSGKTTLVDLLLGVIKPEKGSIEIAGKSAVDAIKKWPGAIGYVPQEASIVNGSIKENICLGYDESGVPDDVILGLLHDVQLEELIDRPGGINAPTGERGSKLSGGQKQRIGIARALFTRPKLLVLDEATSALDATTEAKVSSFLNSLKGSLTMIVVAHRLSTIRNADRILFLQDGEVLGMGTFEELRRSVPEFDNQAKIMGL